MQVKSLLRQNGWLWVGYTSLAFFPHLLPESASVMFAAGAGSVREFNGCSTRFRAKNLPSYE